MEEESVEDSESEMTLVSKRRVYDSKTGIEISREMALAGRKAEKEEMTKNHFFDQVHDRYIRGAARQLRDGATAERGTNADLWSGDWIEGPRQWTTLFFSLSYFFKIQTYTFICLSARHAESVSPGM